MGADVETAVTARLVLAHLRANARKQHGKAKRLVHVVVGTGFEPEDRVGIGIVPSQHDDRRLEAVLTQNAHGFPPVDIGKPDIHGDRSARPWRFVSPWFRCPPRSTRILHAAQAARPAPRAARNRRPRSGSCGYSSFLGPRIGITPERRSREIEHSGVKEQAGLLRADEISCHGRHPIKLTVGPAVFDGHVLTLDIPGLLQALMKFRQTSHRKHCKGCRAEIPDHRHRRLLRARRARPRRCAAQERDELATLHSITSSARASTVVGMSRPSALAVFRLMTNSYLVGAWTGKSAGFSPLRMRST